MSRVTRIGATAAVAVAAMWSAGQAASARIVRTFDVAGHELRYPQRVALGPSGLLYVLDTGDRFASPVRLSLYSLPSGRKLRRWRVATESSPIPSMVVDSSGDAYVVAYQGVTPEPPVYHILKYAPSGQLLDGRWAGREWDGHQGYPLLAADAHGHLLVAFDGRIETFDAAGALLTSWQHLPSGDLHNQIGGVAVAASGTVYVADRDGLAALDASGNVGSRIAPPGQGLGQASGSLAPGPQDSVYALRDQRIHKFAPAGEFLGAVAADRRAQWSSAAIAPDASIYVAQNGFGGRSGVVLQLAPITSVDRTPPSVTVDAFTRPAGSRATRMLGRLRYTLSEDASLRVVLLRRASTRDPDNRDFARYLHVATVDEELVRAGTHTLSLGLRAFGYQRPFPSRYKLILIARDDAGNESKPARVSFAIPRR
jgi:hypothetical protein